MSFTGGIASVQTNASGGWTQSGFLEALVYRDAEQNGLYLHADGSSVQHSVKHPRFHATYAVSGSVTRRSRTCS